MHILEKKQTSVLIEMTHSELSLIDHSLETCAENYNILNVLLADFTQEEFQFVSAQIKDIYLQIESIIRGNQRE